MRFRNWLPVNIPKIRVNIYRLTGKSICQTKFWPPIGSGYKNVDQFHLCYKIDCSGNAFALHYMIGATFFNALFFLASQQAAEKAGGGKKGAESAASSSLFGMSLDEARQILNVNDISNKDQILKV